jgi:SpoIID/LytB domain protein
VSLIAAEPVVKVGILENERELNGSFNGRYELPSSVRLQRHFRVINSDGRLVLFDDEGIEVIRSVDIHCRSLSNATFTLTSVTIGIDFHWEQKEDQTYEGNLRLVASEDGTVTAINEIGIEPYLKSVISSEMNAEAPIKLLKAHAITSRSWLVAMLKRQAVVKNADIPSKRGTEIENEIIRWYDREDHSLFDVCADDHCQRYQGISKIISTSVEKAINATRGTFLIYNEEICDARYSKACGGRTELFENCWENTPIPYLQSISDSVKAYPPVMKDEDAERWILSSPDVYCNTSESKILRQVLPSFDQETTDFFRWKVEHKREELEEIIHSKSGIDFGTLMDLIPMKRGPSGRINSLKIVGTKHTMTVGKELEIRKWLSKSHLYSSAFIVRIERGTNNIPIRFTLFGAGWGHGVGLCQIGASVMAMKGYKAEDILKHYFPGAKLQTLY